MTDELVKRHIEALRLTGGDLGVLCQPLADAIEALTAERDRLRACVDAVMLDRKRIMEDRDLIMQCRICPSCRDSLDLPSGDGCANMPAHDPLGRIIPVRLEDL